MHVLLITSEPTELKKEFRINVVFFIKKGSKRRKIIKIDKDYHIGLKHKPSLYTKMIGLYIHLCLICKVSKNISLYPFLYRDDRTVIRDYFLRCISI